MAELKTRFVQAEVKTKALGLILTLVQHMRLVSNDLKLTPGIFESLVHFIEFFNFHFAVTKHLKKLKE